MLRALIALLLVVNGLLLAGLLGVFDGVLAASPGDREPERLRRQIRPEAVQLTPGGPSSGPAAALGSSAAASGVASPVSGAASGMAGPALPAAPVASALPGASATAASSSAPAGPLACWQAGPFDAGQLAQAGRVMRAAGFPDSTWQNVAMPPARSWLVVMGPYPDRNQLARKELELRRRNVDFSVLGAGPEVPAGVAGSLALGRYDSEAAAEAGLDRLAARGVRSARVVELAPAAGLALLRVPAADAAQQASLAQLALPAGLRWAPCPAAPNGAASAVNGRR